MKPAPFTYHDPSSLEEAVQLLARLDNVRPLAGGQSLMPMLNFRVVRPDNIVDLNRIRDLAGIIADGGSIRIGAMTRQSEIEESHLLHEQCPILRETLSNVGHRQTRNRGTLGGSLAHMDPSAELPIVALALRARLQAQSVRGTREIEVANFPVSYMTTALQSDELLVGLSFTPWSRGHGYAFEEFARRRGDFAVVAVAVLLRLEAGRVMDASVALGGVGPCPIRLDEVEAVLRGSSPDIGLAEAAGEIAGKVDAHTDGHASCAYRQRLSTVLVERAVTRALARAEASAGATQHG